MDRQDFYSAEHISLVADAIVCRHTLEHIQPVDEFMRIVRESIGDRLDTPVLFELPDVARVLDEIAFWDVYYEHCSYFSAGSLARLFRHTGFDVLDVRLDYDDQYILLEALPSADPIGRDLTHLPLADDLDDLAAAVDAFGPRYSSTMDELFSRHDEWAAAGERVVVWGAGSKAVAYLTTLGRRSGSSSRST